MTELTYAFSGGESTIKLTGVLLNFPVDGFQCVAPIVLKLASQWSRYRPTLGSLVCSEDTSRAWQTVKGGHAHLACPASPLLQPSPEIYLQVQVVGCHGNS